MITIINKIVVHEKEKSKGLEIMRENKKKEIIKTFNGSEKYRLMNENASQCV